MTCILTRRGPRSNGEITPGSGSSPRARPSRVATAARACPLGESSVINVRIGALCGLQFGHLSRSEKCRLCCKSPKSNRDDFSAKRRSKPRSSMDMASSSLARLPVSSSPCDEVPHMFTRKPRLQPGKFFERRCKRLLQHNLPIGDIRRPRLSPLRKNPAHVDARETRLGMELRRHHTMCFDKSHVGVHHQILRHGRVGVELDGG